LIPRGKIRGEEGTEKGRTYAIDYSNSLEEEALPRLEHFSEKKNERE